MRIDPSVEEPARDLLGHVIRGEFSQFTSLAGTVGTERFMAAGALCLEVAGYIAIDVCGWQWPADDDVREIAQRITAIDDLEYDLDETDAYDLLAHCALRFEPVFDVFPDKEKAVTVPFLVTATLLIAYRPKGGHWWDYLDLIERALEDVAPLSREAFPAALLLSRRSGAIESRQAGERAAGA